MLSRSSCASSSSAVVEGGIDLERSWPPPRRAGGFSSGEDAGEPGMCRRPLRIGFQHLLERPQCFGLGELLEKQPRPTRYRWPDRRRRRGRGRAEQRVCFLRKIQRLCCAGGTRENGRIGRTGSLPEDRRQQPPGPASVRPSRMMQQSELQRGGSERHLRGGWFEDLYGFVVLPLADREMTENRGRVGITGAPAARFGLGVRQLAMRDCGPGARRETDVWRPAVVRTNERTRSRRDTQQAG